MSRKLKVYGWMGWRQEAKPSMWTREIVATTSKAKVRGLVDSHYIPTLKEISETGNDDEIATAMSEPGVVFWHLADQIPKGRRWIKQKRT